MPSESSCQPVTSTPTRPQLALGEWERRKAPRCGHAGCLVRRRSLPQTQASAPAVTDCRHGGGRWKDVLGGTMVVRPSRWTWLVCCLRKEDERERLTGFSQERGARARGGTGLASPATWPSVGLGATSQALPPIPPRAQHKTTMPSLRSPTPWPTLKPKQAPTARLCHRRQRPKVLKYSPSGNGISR